MEKQSHPISDELARAVMKQIFVFAALKVGIMILIRVIARRVSKNLAENQS